ncbi:MAG: terminase small subunit [Chloroflexi bacterium]|nr:terminase small subunit [Chloroflexota bacterium]
MTTLTSKRRIFIDEYLKCWNAAEAARRAGYSEKTARTQGSKLLTNADIKAAIKARIAESAMSADEVLLRLGEQARGSLSDFVDIDPSGSGVYRVNLDKAKERGKLHLIKTLIPTANGARIELHDAQAALVHLGRHHKLFTDKQELTGKDGGAIEIDHTATNKTMDLFATAISTRLSGTDSGGAGDMEPGEPPPDGCTD